MSGRFAITYRNGEIVSVKVERSTGDPRRDQRAVSWIKAKFRVQPGASGQRTQPVTWRP